MTETIDLADSLSTDSLFLQGLVLDTDGKIGRIHHLETGWFWGTNGPLHGPFATQEEAIADCNSNMEGFGLIYCYKDQPHGGDNE